MATPTISSACPILLGSGSPRRREILAGLGLPFCVSPPDVDESVLPDEVPEAFLARVVSDKMAAVRSSRPKGDPAHSVVLVADTVVLIDGRILGKPTDKREALTLLRGLAGRTHYVHTRYALAPEGGRTLARTVVSEVSLRAAGDIELQRYAASGEGLDKAGAYAAQGLGSFLVERISGSYSNVVGLPACELIQDLKLLGLLSTFPL